MPFLYLALAVAGVAGWFILGKKKVNFPTESEEIGNFLELEKLLIDLEGKRYEPYMDSTGNLTVGVGHKIEPSEMLYLNRALHEGEIRELLYQDINKFLPLLSLLPPDLGKNKSLAVLSFAFNVGYSAAKSSTLFKRINAGDPKASEEFEKWVYGTVNGQKIVIEGLVNRRKKERALFDKK